MLGGALVISLAVAIQHFYDRFYSRGLYKSAVAQTASLPTRIGLEVEGALNRVAEAQERKYAEAAEKAGLSDKMSLIRNVRTAREEEKELLGMVAETVSGPLVEGLRLAWPDMADKLEDLLATDPARAIRLWEVARSIPWVQQNVISRLPKALGGQGGESSSGNPFLKDLGV
jgi:hypothetical protein